MCWPEYSGVRSCGTEVALRQSMGCGIAKWRPWFTSLFSLSLSSNSENLDGKAGPFCSPLLLPSGCMKKASRKDFQRVKPWRCWRGRSVWKQSSRWPPLLSPSLKDNSHGAWEERDDKDLGEIPLLPLALRLEGYGFAAASVWIGGIFKRDNACSETKAEKWQMRNNVSSCFLSLQMSVKGCLWSVWQVLWLSRRRREMEKCKRNLQSLPLPSHSVLLCAAPVGNVSQRSTGSVCINLTCNAHKSRTRSDQAFLQPSSHLWWWSVGVTLGKAGGCYCAYVLPFSFPFRALLDQIVFLLSSCCIHRHLPGCFPLVAALPENQVLRYCTYFQLLFQLVK